MDEKKYAKRTEWTYLGTGKGIVLPEVSPPYQWPVQASELHTLVPSAIKTKPLGALVDELVYDLETCADTDEVKDTLDSGMKKFKWITFPAGDTVASIEVLPEASPTPLTSMAKSWADAKALAVESGDLVKTGPVEKLMKDKDLWEIQAYDTAESIKELLAHNKKKLKASWKSDPVQYSYEKKSQVIKAGVDGEKQISILKTLVAKEIAENLDIADAHAIIRAQFEDEEVLVVVPPGLVQKVTVKEIVSFDGEGLVTLYSNEQVKFKRIAAFYSPEAQKTLEDQVKANLALRQKAGYVNPENTPKATYTPITGFDPKKNYSPIYSTLPDSSPKCSYDPCSACGQCISCNGGAQHTCICSKPPTSTVAASVTHPEEDDAKMMTVIHAPEDPLAVVIHADPGLATECGLSLGTPSKECLTCQICVGHSSCDSGI